EFGALGTARAGARGGCIALSGVGDERCTDRTFPRNQRAGTRYSRVALVLRDARLRAVARWRSVALPVRGRNGRTVIYRSARATYTRAHVDVRASRSARAPGDAGIVGDRLRRASSRDRRLQSCDVPRSERSTRLPRRSAHVLAALS